MSIPAGHSARSTPRKEMETAWPSVLRRRTPVGHALTLRTPAASRTLPLQCGRKRIMNANGPTTITPSQPRKETEMSRATALVRGFVSLAMPHTTSTHHAPHRACRKETAGKHVEGNGNEHPRPSRPAGSAGRRPAALPLRASHAEGNGNDHAEGNGNDHAEGNGNDHAEGNGNDYSPTRLPPHPPTRCTRRRGATCGARHRPSCTMREETAAKSSHIRTRGRKWK